MVDLELFSKRLRELRKEKGITTTKLAKELKMNRSVVCKYELGLTFPYKKVDEFAIYFNVSIDYLFGLTDIKKRYK